MWTFRIWFYVTFDLTCDLWSNLFDWSYIPRATVSRHWLHNLPKCFCWSLACYKQGIVMSFKIYLLFNSLLQRYAFYHMCRSRSPSTFMPYDQDLHGSLLCQNKPNKSKNKQYRSWWNGFHMPADLDLRCSRCDNGHIPWSKGCKTATNTIV